MKVYLIGYMGVGKSTIGKKLASRLDIPFYDLDAEIEAFAEMSVLQIFENKGENYFRHSERNLLVDFTQKKESFVLSTGGGAASNDDNLNFMLQSGVVVWLKMAPKMLVSRLEQAIEKRPLIKDVVNLESFITSHLQERTPYYSRAQIHFAAGQASAKQLDFLASEIQNYSR